MLSRPAAGALDTAPRRSVSLLSALIQAMPQPIVLMDTKFQILFANEPFLQTTKRSSLRVAGRFLTDVLPPEAAAAQGKLLEEVRRTGRPSRIESAQGDRAFIYLVLPALDERGKADCLALVSVDITERKKAEKDLRRRLDMQDIIARISSQFINLPLEDIDDGIERALEEIGRFTHTDRGYVLLIEEDKNQASCTHEWRREGIPSLKAKLQNLPLNAFRWGQERIRHQEAIRIPSLDDLPPEAEIERQFIKAHDTLSALAVPMVSGTTLRGFLGFDGVRQKQIWPEETVALLGIVGQTLINALERKRFEAVLQESEQKYRLLVDKSLLGIYIVQNFVLKFCNQRFAEMSGYSRPEEIIGRSMQDLVVSESREQIESELARRESGQKDAAHYELKTRRPDGSTLEIEILSNRILYEGQPASQGMMIDITERKKSERLRDCLFSISKASATSATLEELYRSIHVHIAELMPAKNFYIALYNPQSQTVEFPYHVDEYDQKPAPKPLGRGLTDYILRTGEPLLISPEVFDDLERRGEVESIGTPSIDWLGVPLKMEGETRGVLVVQSYTSGLRYGVTEKAILTFVSDQVAQAIARKQVESSLRERERFLASTFDSIKDGLSVLGLDYTILRVNQTMENWYAHTLPLVGKKCYEAYHLRQAPCQICPTRTALQMRSPAYEVVPKVGPGGEVTGWLDLYSFPLMDQVSGQMTGVIEYVRDITDQKRAENALRASLQEKEVLLREIHHRVKNNMQIISSLLNLQAGQLKDEASVEIFRDSQRRIRSMALVHERLYQSPDFSHIEFSEYLRTLADQLFNSYRIDPARVQVSIQAEETFLNVNTAVPCGLIINELLSNTLKHAFPDDRSGEVVISLGHEPSGDYLLRVKDSGVGWPSGVDFRRTSSLGMQIVTMLVSQLEGTIELSREGGTEFIITFREAAEKPWPRGRMGIE